ncbi:MAG: hypothetical protein HFE65_04775 [Clostridiales bacterium]|nr:hypothetical protein [Clostridiales bacterium]
MTQALLTHQHHGIIRTTTKRVAGDIILLYHLTEDPLPPNQFSHTAKYSLNITKVDCGGTRKEECHLPDITRNHAEAEQIFDIISKGMVTPCTVHDVISDLFAL